MRIAEEGRLQRCGTQREEAEAMRRGVAGEVDEQVDPVGEDRLLQRFVVEPGRLEPAIGGVSGPASVGVVHAAGVIEADFEAPPIMPQENRQHEQIDRVLAMQIAGDVADAQAALAARRRRAGVGEVGLFDHRRFDRRAEAAMQRGDFAGRQAVVVERGHGDAGGQARERVARA
jgi:hypothetical protein